MIIQTLTMLFFSAERDLFPFPLTQKEKQPASVALLAWAGLLP